LSVSQQQVLDGLAKVTSPRGVPLVHANVLSEISVTDGKVLFSINVDAAEARAWESVRAQAEAAVRAIPGVTGAMVALTAERKPGAAPATAPHRHGNQHRVHPMVTTTGCSRCRRIVRRKIRRARRCRNRLKSPALPR
jgi:ATP-binding protein involved in chromosome partitioning